MLEVKFGDEPLIRSPMLGKVALTNHKGKLTNCSNPHSQKLCVVIATKQKRSDINESRPNSVSNIKRILANYLAFITSEIIRTPRGIEA